VNGLLVVDKPGGMTSHDVVARVRKITGQNSIGHLGTLDPMATGVLPLLMGKFTRLAQFFSTSEKSYSGSIRFGFATTTYDAEGEVSGSATKADLTIAEVRAAAAYFSGQVEQVPPPFSAKKVSGTPAYKLARAGKPVFLKPVAIHIHAFEIHSLEGDAAHFTIKVSSGGYVRSVAHELGQKMGCGAHLASLRRTQAGLFTLEDSHSLEALAAQSCDASRVELLCVHPRRLMPEFPCVTGDQMALGRLRNGQQANLPEFSTASLVKVFDGQRDLVGIARRVAGTLFQPVLVFGSRT
jgi:tRNA pseudouridine55 synthase